MLQNKRTEATSTDENYSSLKATGLADQFKLLVVEVCEVLGNKD